MRNACDSSFLKSTDYSVVPNVPSDSNLVTYLTNAATSEQMETQESVALADIISCSGATEGMDMPAVVEQLFTKANGTLP